MSAGGKVATTWTEFRRLSGMREGISRAERRETGFLPWWVIYPVTLLECVLMALVSVASWCLWRIVYVRWWYPDHARQRPGKLAKPQIDVSDALAAMQTIERMAAATRARIFWISGTLLGLERLGHPLPHDKDMDVGLHVDDPHGLDFIRALWGSPGIVRLVPQFLSTKTLIQNPDLQGIPFGIIRYTADVAIEGASGKPPVKLDVFLHFPYCGGSVHGTRNSLWWNTPPGVTHKAYGDRNFSVPQDVHRYLRENYGNYREEVREFENSIDCPNVMDVFSWKSFAYLITRQRMLLRLGRVARARQVNQRLKSTILKGLLPLVVRQSQAQRGS